MTYRLTFAGAVPFTRDVDETTTQVFPVNLDDTDTTGTLAAVVATPGAYATWNGSAFTAWLRGGVPLPVQTPLFPLHVGGGTIGTPEALAATLLGGNNPPVPAATLDALLPFPITFTVPPLVTSHGTFSTGDTVTFNDQTDYFRWTLPPNYNFPPVPPRIALLPWQSAGIPLAFTPVSWTIPRYHGYATGDTVTLANGAALTAFLALVRDPQMEAWIPQSITGFPAIPRELLTPPASVPAAPVVVTLRLLNDVPMGYSVLAPDGTTDGGFPVYRAATITGNGTVYVYGGAEVFPTARTSLLPAGATSASLASTAGDGIPWWKVSSTDTHGNPVPMNGGLPFPGGAFAAFNTRALGTGPYAVEKVDGTGWLVLSL